MSEMIFNKIVEGIFKCCLWFSKNFMHSNMPHNFWTKFENSGTQYYEVKIIKFMSHTYEFLHGLGWHFQWCKFPKVQSWLGKRPRIFCIREAPHVKVSAVSAFVRYSKHLCQWTETWGCPYPKVKKSPNIKIKFIVFRGVYQCCIFDQYGINQGGL